jgi:putative lipoprotein
MRKNGLQWDIRFMPHVLRSLMRVFKNSTIILCLLIAFLSAGCTTSTATRDAWFGYDKALHFGVAAGFSAGASMIAKQQYQASDSEAYAVGISVALSAGAAKEWYDVQVKQSFWSWKDFFWDMLGGLVGSLAGIQRQ